MEKLPIQSISPSATARRASSPDEDQALLQDIKERGVLEPLLLREDGSGKYTVVHGNRRLELAKKAGVSEVPYQVIAAEDIYSLNATLNFLHAPLRPIDTYDYIATLFCEKQKNNPEETTTIWKAIQKDPTSNPDAVRVISRLCKNFGLGAWEEFIAEALKVLKIPEAQLSKVRDGDLNETQATALAKVKDNTLREKLTRQASSEQLSAKEISTAAKKADPAPAKKPAKQEPKEASNKKSAAPPVNESASSTEPQNSLPAQKEAPAEVELQPEEEVKKATSTLKRRVAKLPESKRDEAQQLIERLSNLLDSE